MIFYTATKEAATTTHKNTVEEQYRHVPLNGLIIGAIVGAVWALVVLGYLISLLLTEQDTELCPPELVMSPIFPVAGWLTGLWQRTAVDCDDITKQKRRVKAITAVMSSLAGVLMGSIERFLTTLRFINGKETLIYYLILLAVFSLIGCILGTVDITLKENGSHFLIKMGAATAIALFTSVAVSFYVFNAMQIIFFFEV
ncbi:hypothetical protein U6U79_11075 [Cutibacterium acnes]|uniref:hypothetical protein n=1 Tax=Cutibacterium acnes TaxID=1747 RepID=UPI0002BB029D|nr:hypothetical protein [Cutibacterium acnes]EMF63558.1 hypothetical protein TIA1EST31_09524 [Cutibacterium acnes FZ1/2/0]